MGQSSSKALQPLTEQELQKSRRKCLAYIKGLESCRKANPSGASKVCKNLDVKVVTCYAEDHAKEEAAEHRKCYMKLYQSGMYKGLGHCIPYEEAMRACLKKRGMPTF